MKNILVRADSSSQIGIGHIMRDLVLVKEYPNSNIIFACQDLEGNINNKIKESGYKIQILKSNSFEELDSLLKSLKIDFLVIDHYKIDYNFEKKLKIKNSKLKILSFDDTYEKHYCDILLNHNIYGEAKKYDGLVPKSCELRCGLKYTLIRDEFLIEKLKNKEDVKKYIALSFGGTDHLNLNIRILKLLKSIGFTVKVKVITTSSNIHLSDLSKYCLDENIELIINTNKIAKYFHNAFFVISSTSTVVGELMFLNVPFIAIKTADNQNMMYEFLKEKNYNVLKEFDEKKLEKMIRSNDVF